LALFSGYLLALFGGYVFGYMLGLYILLYVLAVHLAIFLRLSFGYLLVTELQVTPVRTDV
jgi:hypothetical protein